MFREDRCHLQQTTITANDYHQIALTGQFLDRGNRKSVVIKQTGDIDVEHDIDIGRMLQIVHQGLQRIDDVGVVSAGETDC